MLVGSVFKMKPKGLWTKKPIPVEVTQIQESFEIATKEGTMKGKPEDYLIRGIQGEYYPCDKEIFEKSYQKYLIRDKKTNTAMKHLEEVKT